jgi:hypothetical protein
VPENIYVTTLPSKTEYVAGEALDLTGLSLTVSFSDGSSAVAYVYITDPVNGAILDHAGTVTVTVSYTFFDVTVMTAFDVTVNDAVTEPVLDRIEITMLPLKTVYVVGDTLDLTGLAVTAIYSDGSSAAVTGYTTNPVNGTVLNTAGTITVTVTYTEDGVTVTASFIVTVNGSANNVGAGVQIVATAVLVLALVIFLIRR